jgi:NADP-dependent 3-hydroxy acid dehydrogenase YdfG
MDPSPSSSRVAVVTGAARGIGAAVATALAQAGHLVVVADRDRAAAERTAGELTGTGAAAVPCGLDVRDWVETERVFGEVVERHGRLDVLVANAGIGSYTDVATGDPLEWRAVVETNLLGVMHSVRGALPTMKAQGRGDVVLMASIAARQAWAGEPIYISTKWGVVGFGWALRKELATTGVRVSMIEPGTVDTPLVRSTEEGRRELEQYAALQPEDVARAVVYAVSQPPHMSATEIMVLPLGPDL